MSRVGLAVAVVAVLFCVYSAVCESDICSGVYQCRSLRTGTKRRSDHANVTVGAADTGGRMYFTATRKGKECLLEGLLMSNGFDCYLGVTLYTVHVTDSSYAFKQESTSDVAFYDDGFGVMLYASVCDIGGYKNPCGCSGQYDGCACGIDTTFECFAVGPGILHRMSRACEALDAYTSGTCD
jgi:hypothetical protein